MPNKNITIEAILSPELTQCGLPGSSKKKVLEHVAKLISAQFSQLDENTIFDNLIARERLGSDHPERVMLKVIERMMPKDSPLARKQMKNLYIYAGSEHEQAAQKPKVWDLAKKHIKNKKR